MKLSKRALLAVVSMLVALSMTTFGTIAYLTSTAQATNTFTVGDVEITLDETDVDEQGNPKYPVDTDGDGEPDIEVSTDGNTITIDPTPDDDSDEPIVIYPNDDGTYPPTDIDGDGDEDQIEVDENGNIIITPEGGDPTTVVPGTDIEIDEDGNIIITDEDGNETVIEPNEDGTYPPTDVDGDGDPDNIVVDEDGNIIITDEDGNTIVADPDKDDGNDYKLVPGESYLKDPTITLLADSEPSYVRMRVVISNYEALKGMGLDGQNALEAFVEINNGWAFYDYVDNGDSISLEYRYDNIVNAAKGDNVLPALFETFTVPGDIYEGDLEALSGMAMEVYGDAIQAASFESADEAWAAFDNQNSPR